MLTCGVVVKRRMGCCASAENERVSSGVALTWLCCDVALHRQHGYAQRGRRLQVARGWVPSGPNYTMSIMTSLTAPHGFVCSTPRTASNTSYDFLLFLVELAQDGYLTAGDVLVLDNASVHTSSLIGPQLRQLLAATGIRLLYLPTYSPELNPCELVFAMIKNHMRRTRNTNRNMLFDLIDSCTRIDLPNITRFYDHCLNRFDQ